MNMDTNCCTFFKAVADPARIKIMTLLSKGEMCVTDICQHFDMKQPSVSHHLSILKTAGIVDSRKEGKEIYYSLNCCCVSTQCSSFMQKFMK